MRTQFRHLRSNKFFQWYKKLFNIMNFDPYNHILKIRESIGTPTPNVEDHLGVWGFIPSHFPTLPNFTIGLHLYKPLIWLWAQS
jgi:hypothetical protein